jgi:hypothetical protein
MCGWLQRAHCGEMPVVGDTIARWIRPNSCCGDRLDRYEVHQVGGDTILEYWIPAEDLDEFNAHLIGRIEVIAEFR